MWDPHTFGATILMTRWRPRRWSLKVIHLLKTGPLGPWQKGPESSCAVIRDGRELLTASRSANRFRVSRQNSGTKCLSKEPSELSPTTRANRPCKISHLIHPSQTCYNCSSLNGREFSIRSYKSRRKIVIWNSTWFKIEFNISFHYFIFKFFSRFWYTFQNFWKCSSLGW